MRRVLGNMALVAALASAGLFVGAGSVGAQVYPPGGCSIGLSVSFAFVGDQVTVSGTNFPTGPVPVFFDGQQVATGTAASDFTVSFTVPGGAAPGPHTVRAEASNGTCSAEATLNVTAVAGEAVTAPGGAVAAPAGAGGGTLAFTGTSWIVALLLLALLCLTIGTGLVIATKRRAEVQRRFAA